MGYLYGPEVVIPNAGGDPANGNSMATDITSLPVIVQTMYAMSYSLVWSGTSPVGEASVEGSNDFSLNPDGSVDNAGSWNAMTLNYNGTAVTSVPITGNTGNGLIDIVATGVYAIRLVYTATSGTGNLIVVFNAKDA